MFLLFPLSPCTCNFRSRMCVVVRLAGWLESLSILYWAFCEEAAPSPFHRDDFRWHYTVATKHFGSSSGPFQKVAWVASWAASIESLSFGFLFPSPTLVSFPISWWGSLPKCQPFQLSCQLCCIQTQHTDRQSLLYARLRWRERLTENDHHFPGALHFPVQLLARNFCKKKKKKKKSSRALNKSCKWRQSAPPLVLKCV
jgi:hypothetical protein